MKSRQNYKAWEIDSSLFPYNGTDAEKLLFICRYAVLAPSGHNSQPWLIKKESDSLLLSVNTNHYISGKKSGLLPVEPHVSLGTFIQTFLIAAEGFGYVAYFRYEESKQFTVKISLNGKVTAKPYLLDGIINRVSNRNKFSTQPLAQSVVKKITSNTTFKHTRATIITSRDEIEFIAEQTEEGIKRIMKNKKYRMELGEWVRSNITRKKDGMPGFTHGVKLIPSLIAKYGIIYASSLGPPPSHSKELIINSSFLVVIGYEGDNIKNFIDVGRLYADEVIKATVLGVSSSALGAAVIDRESRSVVVKRLKLDYRPVVILRFGNSIKKNKHSPRWPLEEIVVN